MIVLIGLSAKNAILIVEYAKMRVDDGWAVMPALVDTVTVRLRPILMTAFSTVIGAVPLAWASGVGSGSRTSIGTAIIGGMMASTFLSLFLVPVLFLTIEKVFHPRCPSAPWMIPFRKNRNKIKRCCTLRCGTSFFLEKSLLFFNETDIIGSIPFYVR